MPLSAREGVVAFCRALQTRDFRDVAVRSRGTVLPPVTFAYPVRVLSIPGHRRAHPVSAESKRDHKSTAHVMPAGKGLGRA